ncbi:sulfotransferase ssu-1-like [Ornithodoros turicata]|uniref:sulfotransferase ssu-1-like n=1 Tax=Ornithodoros turicata TaxID=34597 RepID=UPI003138883B
MSVQVYRDLDGLFISRCFQDDIVRPALAYQPRPDDVFIVSYPKCGTTWMQHIVYLIYSGGVPAKDRLELAAKTPFLEMHGIDSAVQLPRPAAIKTHQPFHRQPYSDQAKYIYITRNPFDCCVSFYYHTKNIPAYLFETGTFDEFFEMFMKGEVDFGDYFDHLMSWYPHRNDPNVFFLTYEDLKKDPRSWIQKVADFLGPSYGDKLRSDPGILENVLENSSLKSMKKVVNEGRMNIYCGPVDQLPPSLVSGISAVDDDLKKPMTGDFVRKGEVGDWKRHFSSEQVRRLKERIAIKTAGSDVMELWKDLKFEI